MKKNAFSAIICLLALFLPAAFPQSVMAADTKVDFIFSRNVQTFKRDKNGKNIAQFPIITISGVSKPETVTGYTAAYMRTHGGDGARLSKPDAVTTQPSLAGTYNVTLKFDDDVPFVCKNGQKSQEYPAAFVIKRAEQPKPLLRSASPALTDDADRKGGSIAMGDQAIISVAWSSGLKPILTWTAGSMSVVTPEDGKPARFKASTVGTAVLTALLPEDNNYLASETALYTVSVVGSAVSSAYFDLQGDMKNKSGWYTTDVSIVGKNGFTKIVSDGAHPISTDGITTLNFALENDSAGKTETFSVTVKKDSTAPEIDNVRINDSPYMDAPEDYEAAWAAAADYIVTADIFDPASGIAKLEYRVDAGDYVSDENAAFNTEGCASHEFSLTVDNSGHIIWLRATDTAGNVTVKEYILPVGDAQANASSSQSESDTSSSSQSESTAASSSSSSVQSTEPEEETASEIKEPTNAMLKVTEQIDYFKRCNIEAAVAGDIRANADKVSLMLEDFKALSNAEKKALGETALAELRAFFDMLYTVSGKDKAELDPLFVIKDTPPPSSSQIQSIPESESAAVSSSTSSASQSSPESAPKSAAASSSKPVPVSSDKNSSSFNFLYLIPLLAAAAAFCVYALWRKRLAAPKSKFELPVENDDDSYSAFSGFNDPDE